MTTFTNVTVIKKANVYFDGQVTSRTVVFPDGSKKTLGIMMPGDYVFTTDQREVMEILSGDLAVQLDEAQGWQTVRGGESFTVPAKASFSLKVNSLTDYCCSYLD